jgi:hypothetical protein
VHLRGLIFTVQKVRGNNMRVFNSDIYVVFTDLVKHLFK